MDYFHNINVVNNTDQCCPYGNSTPGHSAMKMSLFQSSLPLWLLAYLRKFLRNTHFLAFCLSVYCLKTLFQVIRNDWQNLFWQCNFEVCTKISDQKKRFVEGEWWTEGGVWSHGYCACLWISRSLGTSPGWGHCCVLGHNTLLSQCLSLYPGV